MDESSTLHKASRTELNAFGEGCLEALEAIPYVRDVQLTLTSDWRSLLHIDCLLSGPHLQLSMVSKDLEGVWREIVGGKLTFGTASQRETSLELEFLIVTDREFITGRLEMRLPERLSRLDR